MIWVLVLTLNLLEDVTGTMPPVTGPTSTLRGVMMMSDEAQCNEWEAALDGLVIIGPQGTFAAMTVCQQITYPSGEQHGS